MFEVTRGNKPCKFFNYKNLTKYLPYKENFYWGKNQGFNEFKTNIILVESIIFHIILTDYLT